MRKRIKAKNMVWSTSFKPGVRKITDNRYKDGVDTGRFANNNIPLPLKPKVESAAPVVEISMKELIVQKQQTSQHFTKSNKTKTIMEKETRHYSKKDIATINTLIDENNLSKKPLSLRRLSFVVAKQLNRNQFGVYNKVLSICEDRPNYQKTKRKAVVVNQPVMEQSTQKSISFGKPTKIDITENGMTFYF